MKTWLRGDNSVSLISIPFVLSKIWPGQASIIKNKWLRGDNCKYTEKDYGSCALPFLIMTSIYIPTFIAIPFVLSKI